MASRTPPGEVVVEADQLQRRVAELGAEISRDYEGRDLFMMGVLKGAVFFLADLMRQVDVRVSWASWRCRATGR